MWLLATAVVTAAATTVGGHGVHWAGFPSTTQRTTSVVPVRTQDTEPDPKRSSNLAGFLNVQPARAQAGGNTYLCIFGNLWACLFVGKSGSLPPGMLEARPAKGHKLEEGQEWAVGGGAEARAGNDG